MTISVAYASGAAPRYVSSRFDRFAIAYDCGQCEASGRVIVTRAVPFSRPAAPIAFAAVAARVACPRCGAPSAPPDFALRTWTFLGKASQLRVLVPCALALAGACGAILIK
jgi:hypothetical protein